jgi:hypothetical protein
MFNFNDLKIRTLAKFAYEEKFSGCQIYFLKNTIALIASALAYFEGVWQVFLCCMFFRKNQKVALRLLSAQPLTQI